MAQCKMDSFTIIIILLVLVAIIALVYYLLHFGHIDVLNAKLDEITGQDATIPQSVRKALEPLTFKVYDLKPNGYSQRYEIPPSGVRRVILVTCNRGFAAMLGDQPMRDVLNETRYKQTLSGLLFPGDEPIFLETFAVDETKPVIHISEQSSNNPPTRAITLSPSVDPRSRTPSPIHW